MKKILLALGITAGAGAVTAQEVMTSYDASVFDNYQLLDIANKQAAAVTVQKVGSVFPGFTVTTDKLTGMARDIYGKSMDVPGNTITDKAAYIIGNQLSGLGVKASEWKISNLYNAGNAQYVYLSQNINGRNVAFSQMAIRFTPDGKLQRITIAHFGSPEAKATPLLNKTDVLGTQAFTGDLAFIDVSAKQVSSDWEWFPVPGNSGYTLQPAWSFTITGFKHNDENTPVELHGYIDAVTGKLLYRTDDVKTDVNVAIKGNVYRDGFLNPPTNEALGHIQVAIGSTTGNANDTGYYVRTGINPPQNATITLKGPWADVRNGGVVAATTTIAANGQTYIFNNGSAANTQNVNAYYHVNRVHDHMKKFYPTFTKLDNPLTTNVDVASTTGCNAFYSGTSINFYAENTSCNSFALIGDIIYHEFGHGINGRYYGQVKGTGSNNGMSNGGLNEGYADVWAFTITKDPVLGKGAFKNGGNIRAYNGTPKVFPKDNTSEVHANGEIIAGAWIDAATNIGSVDTMAIIFAKTLNDVPDGPNGTEGDVYHQVLVSALVNDDDDANLANGTPHYNAIVSAFARHGIYLFGVATLDHKELAHQQPGQPIAVTANLTVSAAQKDGPLFMGLKLIYRNRTVGTWDTLSMNNLGPGSIGGINFDTQIPAQSAGSILDYYFVAYDNFGNAAFSFPRGFNTILPLDQVTLPYQFAVGVNLSPVAYNFEAEADTVGWTIGNAVGDNATAGKWAYGTPVATFWTPNWTPALTFIAQPGSDHTTGTGKCMMTGLGGGDYNNTDVDNGRTTLISPLLDLTGMLVPIIEYHRWFTNDRGGRDTNPRTDMFQAQVRDQQSNFWRTVDNTYQADQAWRRRIFLLSDYLPTSKYIYIRFIAADEVNNNLTASGQGNVEVAIDDIFVYDLFPTSVDKKPTPVNMDVYPNPANNTLNVKMGQATEGTLSITDVTGRSLISQNINANTTSYSFNTASLASGTYILMIKANNAVQMRKVAITH